jgi:hypothetical protein
MERVRLLSNVESTLKYTLSSKDADSSRDRGDSSRSPARREWEHLVGDQPQVIEV